MIHSVTANRSSFHPVQFEPGLNVILAERTDTSTQKDTRNGLGKSTLIDIIDFCLGSRATKGKGLIIEPLAGWEFTVEITLAANRVKVTRAIDAPNRFVINGDTSGWIEQPDTDNTTRERVFSLERWKTLLGWSLFGVQRTHDALKYKPTYRSLISYFIRRGVDAYTEPFRHARQQQPWDVQLHTAYLLGLNWENASKWQELKDLGKCIKAIEEAIKTGAMQGAWGTVGELEAERVQLESLVNTEADALKDFKVHPQYEAVQEEANSATIEIHRLTNENVSDRWRLARYKESVAAEKPPSYAAIEKLYEEAGVVFPHSVSRTLEEAKLFHAKIVENRRGFLETEIERIIRRIARRNDEINRLVDSRASSLEILNTHGALQEMTTLQERLVETQGKLDRVRTRISEIKDLTARKRDIKVNKAELAKVAEQDHEQRRDVWTVPVRLFSENSQALYKTPGHLAIDITESGFKYDVEISRSGSEGVGKMKVFCFDLMLLQLMTQTAGRIDFLVHDSGLYDGVDERQRALALERASKITKQTGAQYICALNSDMVPRAEFSDGFEFGKYVRLTLTDTNPSDSLLGFHFERPKK
ncbi:MAG: DUF2326 domain-containing protein [Leptolyngbyaceae bacterium]|nr:DUF2326 domain-containing protein [Leptolyngbyaceae bacterium]